MSAALLPLLVCALLAAGAIKKGPVLEWFGDGALSGFRSLFSIAPFLVGMFVAVGVFRASGAMEWLSSLCAPVLNWLGVPEELTAFILLRPISGSGALAMLSDIFSSSGPDSEAGRMASLMMGSTETIFYTLCVYMGAAGLKKSGYALPAALLAAMAGVAAAVFAVRVGL